MNDVLIDHSVGFLLGKNHNRTIQRWKTDISHLVRTDREFTKRLSTISESKKFESLTNISTCNKNCTSQIKLAVYRREEGSSKRHFINMDDLHDMASEYTMQPLQIVSVNASTPLRTVIELFNAFDILISPHGSHLSNAIFITRPRVTIIEVVGTCFNRDWKINLQHWAKYQLSSTHIPQSRHLRETVQRCEADLKVKNECARTQNCTLSDKKKIVHSNLWINTSSLREYVENAIIFACNCSLTD